MPLTLRTEKGDFLDHEELDYNFVYLQIIEWEYGSYEVGRIVYHTDVGTTTIYVCVKTHSKTIYPNKQFNDVYNGVRYWKEIANSNSTSDIETDVDEGYLPFSDGQHLVSTEEVYWDIDNNRLGILTNQPNSNFNLKGSYASKIQTFVPVSGNTTYQIKEDDYTIIAYPSNRDGTLYLPDATNCRGRIYNIKKATNNTNTINIVPTQSQTIDLETSYSTDARGLPNIKVQSDGQNWFII